MSYGFVNRAREPLSGTVYEPLSSLPFLQLEGKLTAILQKNFEKIDQRLSDMESRLQVLEKRILFIETSNSNRNDLIEVSTSEEETYEIESHATNFQKKEPTEQELIQKKIDCLLREKQTKQFLTLDEIVNYAMQLSELYIQNNQIGAACKELANVSTKWGSKFSLEQKASLNSKLEELQKKKQNSQKTVKPQTVIKKRINFIHTEGNPQEKKLRKSY